MSYLLDTNIFLEILLEQQRAETCRELIKRMINKGVPIFISDFYFFSIAIKLAKANKIDEFMYFKKELIDSGYVRIARLDPKTELGEIADILKSFTFDDAHQYLLCILKNMELITLDSDFYGVEDIKVYSPEDILKIF